MTITYVAQMELRLDSKASKEAVAAFSLFWTSLTAYNWWNLEYPTDDANPQLWLATKLNKVIRNVFAGQMATDLGGGVQPNDITTTSTFAPNKWARGSNGLHEPTTTGKIVPVYAVINGKGTQWKMVLPSKALVPIYATCRWIEK